MSDTGDRVTSRRAFATGAGLLAVAIGGAAKAAGASGWSTAPQPLTPSSAGRQSDLTKLSNTLYNSPSQRQAFVQDPQAFVSKLGLKNVTADDLTQLKSIIADGFCCGGCGCS